MKKNLIICFVLSFAAITCNAQKDTLLNMFRTVHIGKGKKVEIQGKTDQISNILIQSGLTTYYLKKGSFGVADSISIETDISKNIVAVSFLYGYDTALVHETAYQHELKKYRELIGNKGKEYSYTAENTKVYITKWEDASTIFELIEKTVKGKKITYSVIFDKYLYLKKFKTAMDLFNADQSLELLNILGIKKF